jgi:antitoxin MazE
MAEATVGKWGNNLAVRLPGEITKAVGFKDGERVTIESRDGEIVIRRAVTRYNLHELFKGKSPKLWRAIYAEAYDWGPDIGREMVEE